MMVKVSYLVPLYNKQDFIEECIESILKEECESFEIEVCIVDDGSVDSSLKLVLEKYGTDSRIKIASFPENKGKNAACNKAFEISTGDYICLFGADDVLVEGRTNLLLNHSFKNNKAVYGGLIAKNYNLTEEYYRSSPNQESFYSITMRNGLSGGCCIIPRELYLSVFPIPEKLKFEDWWIAYFLVKCENVVVIKDYVTYYRIGEQNDCGFFGGDIVENIKRDYIRHFDYLNEFKRRSDNKYLNKSIDLRNAFCGRELNKTIYLSPFDIYSIKIILYKIFGAKFLYKIKGLLSSLK